MKKSPLFSYWVVLLLDYILPVPLFIAMFFLWKGMTGDPWFAAYTLLVGLAFGYIVPGMGTNLLGLWTFDGPLKLGKYLAHHGFMYSPYFSLILYAFFSIGIPQTIMAKVFMVILYGLVQGLVSSFHDYHGLRCGFIIMKTRKAREGADHANIILDYSPLGFSLFGGIYALSALIALDLLRGDFAPVHWRLILCITLGVTIMGLTGIPYLIKERASIKFPHRRNNPK